MTVDSTHNVVHIKGWNIQHTSGQVYYNYNSKSFLKNYFTGHLFQRWKVISPRQK